MNRLYAPLIIGMIIPTMMVQADLLVNQISTSHLPLFNSPSINTFQNPIQLNNESVKLRPKESVRKLPYDWTKSDLNTKSMLDELSLNRNYSGFLSDVSPEYIVDRNWLGLTKIVGDRNKRSIMVVFCMNKKKKETQPQRPRIHILWTGSKKRMTDQMLIEREYPVDVSIANYRDGYAPREWNIVLPNKKPREVRVSLLWSF
jgi:hypothetical protein